jgi:hypothetical protein
VSDADEVKPEDIFADANFPTSEGDADASFDFGFPMADSMEPATEFPAAEFPATEFPADVPVESEFPATPSSFLTDNSEQETAETEPEVVAVVETSKKKGKEKKEKKKKEKKEKPVKERGPREPMDLGAILSLCFGAVAVLVLIVLNVLIFIAPATPGIDGSSTIYYAVGVNLFGLAFVAVTFLFWKFQKGKEQTENLQLFDVLLGVAVIAFVIGVLCLWTALYRYDFTFKAAGTPTNVQSVIG